MIRYKQLLLKFADYPCKQPCERFKMALCQHFSCCECFFYPCGSSCFAFKKTFERVMDEAYDWVSYMRDNRKLGKRLSIRARRFREEATLDPRTCNSCPNNPNH